MSCLAAFADFGIRRGERPSCGWRRSVSWRMIRARSTRVLASRDRGGFTSRRRRGPSLCRRPGDTWGLSGRVLIRLLKRHAQENVGHHDAEGRFRIDGVTGPGRVHGT